MLRSIGLPELIVIFVAFVPPIFYLLTLQKALERCSSAARTMSPGKVCLLVVPLFNLFWHFFVVNGIAKSLANEFPIRNIQIPDPAPGKTLGLVMCVLSVVSIIPVIGVFMGIAGLLCWIIYWIQVGRYSRRLRNLPMRS